MANWKKVIVSGSIAELNQLSVDTNVNITGSLNVGANQQIGQSSAKLSGSFSGSFEGGLKSVLSNANQPNIVSYDVATGTFSYQGTGSFSASTASYILSSNVDGPLGMNSILSASYAQSGDGVFSGSFSGSFQGNGSGLTDIPASGIVGLNLSRIASGSATASISPNLGLQVNVPTSIDGTLAVTGSITAGNIISAGSNSSLTGSFSGSFSGFFEGVTNLPDLTQGSGIEAFTYDGSSTATVAVSGAASLSTNAVTKWSGNAFVDSSITDGADVTINNAGGVLVQTGGLFVSGASSFHNDVVFQGDVLVQGTASFQNQTNLSIADQFILLNSGSLSFQDSGIVINTGNAQNSGSAWFLETSGTTVGTSYQNGRFAVASGLLPDATTATADEYAVTAKIDASAPSGVPQWGGSNLGQGNMHIDTGNGDIWIYA